MNSAVAILEKLIEDNTVTSKEHVLETASRHASDAQTRFENSFEQTVREISAAWGEPEFNSAIKKESVVAVEPAQSESGEQQQPKRSLGTVVPPWCQGAPRHGGKPKALRLAHWKKPEGVLYIVLRTELDGEREIPLYYDLVLGARRRKPEVDRSTQQLRQTNKSWMAYVVDFFNYMRGR